MRQDALGQEAAALSPAVITATRAPVLPGRASLVDVSTTPLSTPTLTPGGLAPPANQSAGRLENALHVLDLAPEQQIEPQWAGQNAYSRSQGMQ